MIDMQDANEIAKADEFNELIVMYALERGELVQESMVSV